MLIGSDYQLAKLDFVLDDMIIQRRNSFKSLGVFNDERLSWAYHIEHLAKKVSSAIRGLKRTRPYVQQDILLLIYHTLIQPHFDHCDLVWDNISKGLATKLQRH